MLEMVSILRRLLRKLFLNANEKKRNNDSPSFSLEYP